MVAQAGSNTTATAVSGSRADANDGLMAAGEESGHTGMDDVSLDSPEPAMLDGAPLDGMDEVSLEGTEGMEDVGLSSPEGMGEIDLGDTSGEVNLGEELDLDDALAQLDHEVGEAIPNDPKELF